MAPSLSPAASRYIRPATPADLPRILEIEGICFDKQWREDNFIAALKDIFLVYDREGVWGFIVTCFCDIARKGVIMRVAVHPEGQGQGIASTLLREVLGILRGKEVRCVELDVEIVKTDVKRLYEKFGFKTLKVVHLDEEYENDAFYMMKLQLTKD